ncbi:MAG: hypothetical protein HY726_12675 [Candidatus Rokubacteria bacterium]|nr:hypothetical protein [Candidatus Rokubacteria bacterium]
MRRATSVIGILAVTALVVATGAQGYNGGPLRNVTDLSPTCAGCHSSMQKEQLRVEPEAFAASQVVETKHYKQLEAGEGPYKDVAPADRQKLLQDVKTHDANASVTLSAPSSAKPGQEVQVTATVKGGSGVVGVFLLDTDLRFQSRPVSGDGWLIVGAPKVWGPDGKEQTKWVDSRGPGLKKNLNFALIFDMMSDIAARKFPEGKVTWTVRAPHDPGTYSVAVAFIYGSEKASPAGRVERAGTVFPRGGPAGPSSHIRFSAVHQITVR